MNRNSYDNLLLVFNLKDRRTLQFLGSHYLLNCNSVPDIPVQLPVGCGQFNLNSKLEIDFNSLVLQPWYMCARTHTHTTTNKSSSDSKHDTE